jgi:hypothetical protein
MGTGAPSTRKTHVTRIFGTDETGAVLANIWVDVERIDIAKVTSQNPETQWQGEQLKLRWLDDPNGDYNPNGNPARKYDDVVLKVCSPNEPDQNNPSQWVPVQTIRAMRTYENNYGVIGSQGDVKSFQNVSPSTDTTTTRRVERRKISHYDTNIDSDASDAANNGLQAFVVSGDQYQIDASTKDSSQFIDVEVITYYKTRNSGDSKTGNGDDQGNQVKLQNQYLIDASDDQDGTVVGGNGFNPPWRLDPFQNIINCRFVSPAFDAVFVWFSGFASPITLDDLSTFGPNREGLYLEITGNQGLSGSFDYTGPFPQIGPPDSNGGSSSPTAAQTKTASNYPDYTIGIDGSILFLNNGNVVIAITPDGQVASTTDISGIVNQLPSDDFDPSTSGGNVTGFAVANDTACLAISYGGSQKRAKYYIYNPLTGQYDQPELAPASQLFAVGYATVTKDGLKTSEIITGPNSGAYVLVGATPTGNGQYEFDHELLDEADTPFILLINKNKQTV